MTREEASELVDDLLQAAHDYETFGSRKSYREHYREMKEKVISALTSAYRKDKQ
jgi:hypothetical protein